MDLGGSLFGCLFQPQIMILLLLQISVLKLLQICVEHHIHCEWTWVQKTFIVKNFKYFSLKTVTVFLYAASTRNQRIEAFWSRIKKFNLSWWIDFPNLIK